MQRPLLEDGQHQPVETTAHHVRLYDALSAHEPNAQYVGFGVIAALVTALFYWLPGQGRGWPVLVCVALLAALTFQMEAGYGRNLALHIPLGAGIVTVSVLLGL